MKVKWKTKNKTYLCNLMLWSGNLQSFLISSPEATHILHVSVKKFQLSNAWYISRYAYLSVLNSPFCGLKTSGQYRIIIHWMLTFLEIMTCVTLQVYPRYVFHFNKKRPFSYTVTKCFIVWTMRGKPLSLSMWWNQTNDEPVTRLFN